MSIGVQVWSGTASNNSTSDTNINWAEGMAPSQVNDSARAEMASVAKWRDDNNGSIVTSGTTAAYTVTTNQVEAALTAGYTVAFQMHATNDTSATLAVDGLTAKPLQVFTGSNLLGGELTVGNIYYATYSTSGTGQWIVRDNGNQTNNIANSAVTYGKIQNTGASVLLGNPSVSTSTGVQEITLGTNLSFSGTVLNSGNNTPFISVFTSTTAATWQSTTKGGNFPLYIRVRMVGGGGGGSSTSTGVNGTDTSFESWTAVHGVGAPASGANTFGAIGGTGGSSGSGILIARIAGAGGFSGIAADATSNWPGGGGGASFFGGGGVTKSSTAAATASANSGSGGGGGGTTGQNSGSGGGAGEFVEFLITSPSTAYNYTVGAGGAGGATSGGNFAGGAGAAGRIEVIAYWQ